MNNVNLLVYLVKKILKLALNVIIKAQISTYLTIIVQKHALQIITIHLILIQTVTYVILLVSKGISLTKQVASVKVVNILVLRVQVRMLLIVLHALIHFTITKISRV